MELRPLKEWFKGSAGASLLSAAYAAEIACSLVVYRLCAQRFGDTGFAQYSIFRRELAWLLPLVLLGMPIALPFFLNRDKRSLSPALVIFFTAAFLLFLPLWLFKSPFATFFFSAKAETDLVIALWTATVGIGLSQIALAKQRASIRYAESFFFLVLMRVLLPLVVFALSTLSLAHTLTLLGALWFTLSLVWILFSSRPLSFKFPLNEVPTYFKYGIVRTPGELAWFGLLALPSIYISRTDFALAGLTGFSLSLLTVFGTLIEPVAYRLLPMASRWEHTGFRSKNTRECLNVAVLITVLSLAVFIGSKLFLGKLVALFGFSDPRLVKDSEILLWALWPYGIHVAFRSILDGLTKEPKNTYTFITGFVFYICVQSLFPQFGLWNFVMTIYLLAGLTLYLVRKTMRTLERETGLEPATLSLEG